MILRYSQFYKKQKHYLKYTISTLIKNNSINTNITVLYTINKYILT